MILFVYANMKIETVATKYWIFIMRVRFNYNFFVVTL